MTVPFESAARTRARLEMDLEPGVARVMWGTPALPSVFGAGMADGERRSWGGKGPFSAAPGSSHIGSGRDGLRYPPGIPLMTVTPSARTLTISSSGIPVALSS